MTPRWLAWWELPLPELGEAVGCKEQVGAGEGEGPGFGSVRCLKRHMLSEQLGWAGWGLGGGLGWRQEGQT